MYSIHVNIFSSVNAHYIKILKVKNRKIWFLSDSGTCVEITFS